MTVEDFVALVRLECGLHLDGGELHTHFDELPGWDSLHLLKLLTALESATGRTLEAIPFFEARSLAEIHEFVASV